MDIHNLAKNIISHTHNFSAEIIEKYFEDYAKEVCEQRNEVMQLNEKQSDIRDVCKHKTDFCDNAFKLGFDCKPCTFNNTKK